MIEAGRTLLAERGLNLFAVLPTAGLDGLAEHAAAWPSTVLIGSAGRRMWDSIGERGFFADGQRDPVDRHAREALGDFCATVAVDTRVAWPDPEATEHLPIRSFAEAAGWAYRSPMGLGIHPVHGLWHAYRGVVLVAAELPRQHEPPRAHPCERCPERPCLSACPAGAVGGPLGLDVPLCHAERVRPGGCATACHARAACPVGEPYTEPQIAHHFTNATASLVRWFGAP